MYKIIWVYKSIFELDFMKSKYRSNTSDENLVFEKKENLVFELWCAIN